MAAGLATSVVLIIALLVPGWAIVILAGIGHNWRPLLRWCLALASGIAFYPVLFYVAREVLPGLHFGRIQLLALLILCLVFTLWRLRGSWVQSFRFDRFDALALAIFCATLFTRYWIIREQPYPAWSDSLHHTLLTQLTAASGQLPAGLEPYSPTPLAMYHLGLYAIAAVPAILLGVPAHTALLYTAQTLNGLCGIGVFLLLDLKVGRIGALVGLLTVGLLSHQPAYYVNWGRFTQAASQTILLVAFLVSWEAVRLWRNTTAIPARTYAGYLVLAALLNAGVFLLHFRVSAFYLALLAPACAWEIYQAIRRRRAGALFASMGALGVASFILVLPAVVPAMTIYLARAAAETAAPAASKATSEAIYHAIGWQAVPDLVARSWLLALTAVASVFVVARRNRIGLLALVWTVFLIAIGSAYRLGSEALDFVNLSGVIIAFYLPLALVVGAGAEEFLRCLPAASRARAQAALLSIALFAAFILSHARVADLELNRYFVTADDVQVMAWIRENTPPDARFAITTYFWVPDSPHGTDAGYWIPYFTGRATTASTMLFPLSLQSYRNEVVEESRAARQLDLDKLRRLGVRYVYVGEGGGFAGTRLRKDVLAAMPDLVLLHEVGGASVWHIKDVGS